jgi:ubiquinone/menaquinone biosynthesis C-methylase UbiE
MRRIDSPELLDSADYPPEEATRSLLDMGRVNRWFGGVSTSLELVKRVAAKTGRQEFSLLDVAAGFGDVPKLVARRLVRHGIALQVTLLDIARSHLLPHGRSVVASALALPFCEDSFDLISCNLFAHHLEPEELKQFIREAARVSRSAVLINDLIRDPLHVALAYAAYPLLQSPASRHDGVASVRRSYVPEELREMIASAFPQASMPRVETSRHYLFRMGVIVWKPDAKS